MILAAFAILFAIWLAAYVDFVAQKVRYKLRSQTHVSAVAHAVSPSFPDIGALALKVGSFFQFPKFGVAISPPARSAPPAAVATSSKPLTFQSNPSSPEFASPPDATAKSLATSKSTRSFQGRVLGVSTQAPIIQRVYEAVTQLSGVSVEDLSALEARLTERINAIVSPPPFPQQIGGNGNGGGYVAASAASQRIDQLSDTSITNPTIIGGSIANVASATVTGALSAAVAAFDSMTSTELVATNSTTTTLYVSGTTRLGSITGILQATSGIMSSIANGTNGQVLKISGGVPTWGTDIAGSGGSSAWATSTDNLAVYTADPTHVVLIGTNATSTTGNILEVNGNTLQRGSLITQGSAAASSFTATSTATSTFAGGLSVLNFAQTGTATSTFTNGITLTSGCLLVNGSCITSATFGYPFPSNATTTAIAFNGGLTTTNSTTTSATSTNSFAGRVTGTTGAFGSTGNTTIDAAGNVVVGGTLGVTGNTTLGQATTTNLAISTITSGSLLKTTTGGALIAAVGGVDYALPSATFGYPFVGNSTTTLLSFAGGLTTTNATGTTLFGGSVSGNVASFGATATSSFNSAGALTLATACPHRVKARSGSDARRAVVPIDAVQPFRGMARSPVDG